MVFIITVILITPLKELLVLARSASYLNCASTTISVGSKLLCIFVDMWFYFVVIAISAGITFVYARKIVPILEGENK